jgi:hypothetical protein
LDDENRLSFVCKSSLVMLWEVICYPLSFQDCHREQHLYIQRGNTVKKGKKGKENWKRNVNRKLICELKYHLYYCNINANRGLEK